MPWKERVTTEVHGAKAVVVVVVGARAPSRVILVTKAEARAGVEAEVTASEVVGHEAGVDQYLTPVHDTSREVRLGLDLQTVHQYAVLHQTEWMCLKTLVEG